MLLDLVKCMHVEIMNPSRNVNTKILNLDQTISLLTNSTYLTRISPVGVLNIS